jgi:hypothetical protein
LLDEIDSIANSWATVLLTYLGLYYAYLDRSKKKPSKKGITERRFDQSHSISLEENFQYRVVECESHTKGPSPP